MGLTDHVVNLDTWRLEVKGHVKKPLSLTYSQVLDLPPLERRVLLICPGFFANHGQWKGFSILDLLQKADIEGGATHVTISGPGGDAAKTFRCPIEDIQSGKVFLATQVNGKDLPGKHGFPLRLVAEGYYGADWVKYVSRITAEKT